VPGCAAQVLAECALLEGPRVADVVIDAAVGQPLRQAPARELVLERFAPDGAVAHAALVSEPFRLSRPTRPGHCPLQFASVRIGPVCFVSPGRTWLVYCHTASATTSGTAGSICRNASMPWIWLSRSRAGPPGRRGGRGQRAVEVREGTRHRGLEGLLRRPAHAIGREPGIPTRNEADFTRHGWSFREGGPPRRSRPAGRLAKAGRSRTT